MAKLLGTIISTVEGPSTAGFSFVVTDKSVRRGQFAVAETESGKTVASIQNIFRANRYFERAESVSEYEKTESSFHDHFPAADWEYTVAQCSILGVFDGKTLRRNSFPPSPGGRVFEADEELLKKVLEFDENGLFVGKLLQHNVDVRLNLTKLFQKHVALLAMSGAGKCLDYDVSIFLASGNAVKIGKFAEDVFEESGGSSEEEGVEKAIPKNELRVVSLNENLGVSESRVLAVTRRKAPKMLKIKTRLGREAVLTPEHPLLTAEDGKLCWKPAKDFEKGTFIAVPRELKHSETSEVNLLEFYKKSGEIHVFDKTALQPLKTALSRKQSLKSIAKNFGVAYTTLRNWFNSGSVPMNRYWQLLQIAGAPLPEPRFVKHKAAFTTVPSRLFLTEELGRLVGYFMGDGNVNRNQSRYTSCTPETREDFERLSAGLFGMKPSTVEDDLILNSKTLVFVLRDVFGVRENAGSKTVTSVILTACAEFKKGFLSALFDSDASVSKKKPEIEYCSKSETLAQSVSTLLLSFGVQSVIRKKLNKKYGYYYHVFVRGSENLSKYRAEIGFCNKKKMQRLEHFSGTVPNTNIDVVPGAAELVEELAQRLRISLAEIARRGGLSETVVGNCKLKKHAISRLSLSKLANALQERSRKLEDLCLMIENTKAPETDETALLQVVRETGKDYQYKQIAEHSSVSATTVRRMLLGLTSCTDNVFQMASALASKHPNKFGKALEDYERLMSPEFLQRLFNVAKMLGASFEKLDEQSELWGGAWASYERGEKKASFSSRVKMLQGLKLEAAAVLEVLAATREKQYLVYNLSRSAVFWDRISSVEDAKASGEYVYDLVLENNHNFFAGLTPIIVHNSVLAAVLIEELLKRKKPSLACLVFDVHGEYVGFGDKKRNWEYAAKTTVIDGEKIRIAAKNLTAPMVAEFVPEMSPAQVRDLESVLETLRKKMNSEEAAFDLDDIVAEIETSDMKENVKGPLLAWVSGLKKMRLFGKADWPSAGEAVKQGELAVFDLSKIVFQKKKQVILAYFAKKFFSLRRAKAVPPFLLVVEEAHNFCREKAPKGGSLSRGIIETVAREGRKFGASLCLISQRPVQLSTTALSQCNTFVILRVTNPYDLDHIGQSCEAIDSSSLGQITTLKVGEGIIIGEATGIPVFVSFRNRESVPGKAETLEEMAEKYSSEKEAGRVSDEDLDAFL